MLALRLSFLFLAAAEKLHLTEHELDSVFDDDDAAISLLQLGKGSQQSEAVHPSVTQVPIQMTISSLQTNVTDNSTQKALPLHVQHNVTWYFGIHASSGNPYLPHSWKGVYTDGGIFLLLMTPLVILSYLIEGARSRVEGDKLMNDLVVKTAMHASFAFVNGWVNVIMMVRYRMFATMMVGNTIMMGVSYVCHQHPDKGNSCPTNLRDVDRYAIMIILFVSGAMIYGFIDRKWNSTKENLAFGILLVTACLWDEMFISDSSWDLYIFSPLFGAAGAMAANGGLGGVPWAATGNMLKAGYHSSRYLATGEEKEWHVGISQVAVWASFLFGILMGCQLESELALTLNCVSLAGIFYFLGVANPK